MKDLLLKETLSHYNKVISIYENSGYNKSYVLNAFWSDANMKDMLKILNNSNTAMEAIHSAQRTFMFSVNTSDSIKEKAVDWLLANQRRRGIDIFDMDKSIQESSFSNPENNALRKKRILTPDFLRTVNIAHEIKKYSKIGKSRFYIIELGSGCGHLARTLRLFIPNCSYLIIDIPEALSFSYMFLKLNFPNLKMLYITDEHQLKECSTHDFDYIIIPTKYAEDILENRFDLFINTASIGEMKNSVIHYWMNFIQNKLKVKYLFTLNRYLNTIKTDGSMNWRLEENECSVSYDANWEIINWELEPSFTRCPYVDTIIARYLEIVAEKMPLISITDKKKRSQQLLFEVMDEDWVRLERSFPPEMTYRENILVNDMTMNGTLFKLWESIRLDTNELNVAVMLKYLETLLHKHDREFEETYYYENLFNNLFVSKDNKDLLKIYDFIARKRNYRNILSQPPPSLFLPIVSFCSPRLVEEGYEGYNIIKLGTRYWALLQSLGPIDLSQPGTDDFLEKFRAQGKCLSGDSLLETKYLITKSKNSALQAEIAVREQNIGALKRDVSHRDENIAKLNAEIQAHSKKIEVLQAEIAVREQDIVVLKRDVSHRDENIAKLNAEIQAHSKKMETLQKEVEDRDLRIDGLQKEVSEKDRNIKGLTDWLESKDRKVETLEKEVSDRDTRLKDFQRSVSEKEAEIHSLKSEILDRDSKIKGLQKDVLEKAENIRKLNADISGSFVKIEGLQKEIIERDSRIDGLQNEVSDRDGNIKVLTEKLEGYSKKIETLQAEITVREKNIGALKRDLSHRDENIVKLNAEIQAHSKRIEVLEKEVTDRNLRIDGLQKEAIKKENNIAKLNIEVKECNKEIENLEVDILSKNRNIETLKKDISNRDKNIVKLSNDIEAHNKNINTLQTHLLEKDKNIEDLNKGISKKEEEISKLNNESAVMGSYIKELQEELVDIKSKWWFKFLNRKS